MTIRVTLADDHRMLREALRGVLSMEDDLTVVAEAGDGAATLEVLARVPTDVLVLDIRMPEMNGVEVVKHLRAQRSTVKILALSAFSDKRFVHEVLKAGASGYVVKSAAAAELAQAIRAVARGHSYLSPEITRALVDDLSPRTAITAPPLSSLGQREREVLRLIADGHRTAAIATQLKISTTTVETHRRNIMSKLNLHSVAELTKYAVREGLTAL
jgi:two-component system NarL family response regulator